MAKMIIGCGYLGQRVADAWLRSGCDVYAVTRSDEKAQRLRSEGIQPVVADVTSRRSLTRLPPAETVLHALGFDRAAGQSIREVYVESLRNVLACVDANSLKRFIFVSSTGVYGQRDGQWVDERSECRPSRAGGQACLEAEQLLGRHDLAERSTVLRLAGLYGPGRVPRRDEVASGTPIAAPTKGYLNLIHVDDVVNVVLALENAAPIELLVASDGNPVERIEYYREVARLLDAAPPSFGEPDAESAAGQRASASNKRVSNERMLAELQIELRYPSYREGLAAILSN